MDQEEAKIGINECFMRLITHSNVWNSHKENQGVGKTMNEWPVTSQLIKSMNRVRQTANYYNLKLIS